MATASRHASGPHGSGASLEELRGWRAFVHLARELKLARLARLAYPYRRRAVFSVVAMIAVTLSSLAVPYLLKVAIDGGIGAKDLSVLTWVIVVFVGVSLLNNDIDALDQLVTDGVTSLVTNSLTFIGAIVLLFILDWRLALATLTIMLSLIHISEPTRLGMISYAVFC